MRVALYARVSTADQAVHGLSVEAQLHALDEWAKGQTVVDHYVDLGVSARSPASKRPELQRMLKDCEAGKIDLIVFCKLDRFFRNVKEYYKVEDVLERNHVSWRAIQEDYETETAAGRLKVNIMLAVAQDEADRTSERIKAVFSRKKEKGLVPSGAAAFGIKNDKGILKPSADAPKIQAVFDAFINSRSARAVTLRSEELLGHPVSDNGIRYLLKNRSYLDAGVIDRATWDKTQEILAVRAVRRQKTDRVYLFGGLLVCPVCGCKMTAHCWQPKETPYIYYRCYKQIKNGQCSFKKAIREETVEEFLLNRLGVLIDDYNVEVETKQKTRANPSAIKAKMDKLTDLYLSDTLTKEDYLSRYEPLKEALREAETAPKPVPPEVVTDFSVSYQSFSRAARKAFWSRLLVRIIPTEDGFLPVFDRNDNKQLLFSQIVKMGIK